MSKTDNRRDYKLARNQIVSGCPICAPHKGCNKMHRSNNRSWKEHRKTQWK